MHQMQACIYLSPKLSAGNGTTRTATEEHDVDLMINVILD